MADYDVQYDKDKGDWSAKREGASQAAGRYGTQAEAHDAATTVRTTTKSATRTPSARRIRPRRRVEPLSRAHLEHYEMGSTRSVMAISPPGEPRGGVSQFRA